MDKRWSRKLARTWGEGMGGGSGRAWGGVGGESESMDSSSSWKLASTWEKQGLGGGLGVGIRGGQGWGLVTGREGEQGPFCIHLIFYATFRTSCV